MTHQEMVRATVYVFVEAVLELVQDDPHQWSTRPCSTCQAITSMTGKPFGCIKERIRREKK